ncbi:endonuclease domain-containing protein [Microbacterium sp.]|uniref:endonuclease domain-containing protein n=1 Tax=Microbacterium sp. TaxID=51671 RepID=UPI003A8E52B1
MRIPKKLPSRLGDHFSIRTANSAGVGRSRRDANDLHRPFRGTRSKSVPETFRQTIACYQPRMRPEHDFAGRTAARIWGLPLPWFWKSDEPLDIAVPPHLNPPKIAEVKGRRLASARVRRWTVSGVPVVDPISALFTCAPELTVNEAVTIIDALITDADNYPDLGPGRPLATVEDIEGRLVVWGRFPRSGTVRKAIPLARPQVESPKETETRLLITDAGFGEPVVQHEVFDGGLFVARVDLAYPELKIAIEYEGDGHRRDPKQWRTDIRRQRDLEDRGWIVIRLTQDDLGNRGAALLARLRGAITSARAGDAR